MTPRAIAFSFLAVFLGASCQYLPDPPKRICGDGKIQELEECDDGNIVDNDGCHNDCTSNAASTCGNNVIDVGEQCDDGNTNAGDGCSSSCQSECGNEVVDANEQCDGTNINGASCTSLGGFESGTLTCSTSCQFNTIGCVPIGCGNGQPDPNETCDDANLLSNDGCSATCRVEVCGDGIVQSDPARPEQCDDGNVAAGDGCSSSCTTEICGNGIIDAGESCDDGNTSSDDGCSSSCVVESCGDGVKQANEGCDDANQSNADGCLNSCVVASCGDGFVFAGTEQCDDTNTVDTDLCRNNCQLPACGDGVVSTGEQCEPPNTGSCNGQCFLQCQNNAECADNDPCTLNERCDTGVCKRDPAPVDDSNSCTLDFCDPTNGSAIHVPLSGINDANSCTTDSCDPSTGTITHAAVTIDDNNGCTIDACNSISGTISHTPNVGLVCNDSNACTSGDACNASGSCAGALVNIDDGNSCTTDTCSAGTGQISHTANVGQSCNDGNGCTSGDACNAAAGCAGAPVNVDDNNSCTTDGCSGGSIFHNPNTGQGCNDGDSCTTGDSCNGGGSCVGSPVNVDDNNGCTADGCNNGSIFHNPTPGVGCNDGDGCTQNDACNGSGGCSGSPVNVDDNNICTTDGCSNGSIFHNPNGSSCDDGNGCTVGDQCGGGSCQSGGPLNCDDNNACTADGCSGGGCFNLAVSCDDGDFCTFDQCDTGAGCQHFVDPCCGDPCCGDPCCGDPFCVPFVTENPCLAARALSVDESETGSLQQAPDVFSAASCGAPLVAKDASFMISLSKEARIRVSSNGARGFAPILALLPADACDPTAAPIACSETSRGANELRRASLTALLAPGEYVVVIEDAAATEGGFEIWWEESGTVTTPTTILGELLPKELSDALASPSMVNTRRWATRLSESIQKIVKIAL